MSLRTQLRRVRDDERVASPEIESRATARCRVPDGAPPSAPPGPTARCCLPRQHGAGNGLDRDGCRARTAEPGPGSSDMKNGHYLRTCPSSPADTAPRSSQRRRSLVVKSLGSAGSQHELVQTASTPPDRPTSSLLVHRGRLVGRCTGNRCPRQHHYSPRDGGMNCSQAARSRITRGPAWPLRGSGGGFRRGSAKKAKPGPHSRQEIPDRKKIHKRHSRAPWHAPN